MQERLSSRAFASHAGCTLRDAKGSCVDPSGRGYLDYRLRLWWRWHAPSIPQSFRLFKGWCRGSGACTFTCRLLPFCLSRLLCIRCIMGMADVIPAPDTLFFLGNDADASAWPSKSRVCTVGSVRSLPPQSALIFGAIGMAQCAVIAAFVGRRRGKRTSTNSLRTQPLRRTVA